MNTRETIENYRRIQKFVETYLAELSRTGGDYEDRPRIGTLKIHKDTILWRGTKYEFVNIEVVHTVFGFNLFTHNSRGEIIIAPYEETNVVVRFCTVPDYNSSARLPKYYSWEIPLDEFEDQVFGK